MSKAASEFAESVLLTPKENKLVVQTLGKGKKVGADPWQVFSAQMSWYCMKRKLL